MADYPLQANGFGGAAANDINAASEALLPSFLRHHQAAPSAGLVNVGAEDGMPRTLCVGNLDANVSEELISSLFGQIGLVTKSKVVFDGNSSPYALVEFADHNAAALALAALNCRLLLDKETKVDVNWAPRQSALQKMDTPNQFHVFFGDLSLEEINNASGGAADNDSAYVGSLPNTSPEEREPYLGRGGHCPPYDDLSSQLASENCSIFSGSLPNNGSEEREHYLGRGLFPPGFDDLYSRTTPELGSGSIFGRSLPNRFSGISSNFGSLGMGDFSRDSNGFADEDNTSPTFSPRDRYYIALSEGFNVGAEDGLPRTLCVGNLDPSVSEEAVASMFGQVGLVTRTKLMFDAISGPYSLVEFADHKTASEALVAMNRRPLLDREISVGWLPQPGSLQQVDTSKHFHVFIGGLPPEMDAEALRNAFSPFGDVSDVKIIKDPATQKPKGYGFVSYPKREEAERAIEQMDGQWLGRHVIRTNWGIRKFATPAEGGDFEPQTGARHSSPYEENNNQENGASFGVGSLPNNCSGAFKAGHSMNGCSPQMYEYGAEDAGRFPYQPTQNGGFNAGPTEGLPRTLRVSNLDPGVSMEFITNFFGQIGPVTKTQVTCDTNSGPHALVEFADHNTAAEALMAMNGRLLLEKEINVNWATPPNTQPPVDTRKHFHVFVGGLSPQVDSKVLRDAFAPFGDISDAWIVKDAATRKPKGCGFVSYRKREDAERAIEQMNGKWLGRHIIRTNWGIRKWAAFGSERGAMAAAGFEPQQNGGSQYRSHEEISQMGAENGSVYVGSLPNPCMENAARQRFTSPDPNGFMEFAGFNPVVEALTAVNDHLRVDEETSPKWSTLVDAPQNVDMSKQYDVFVGGLSPQVDAKALRDAFAPFGEVCDAWIVKDAVTRKPKGCGFVSYRKREEAERAIERMNGQFLGRHLIRANWGIRKFAAAGNRGEREHHQEQRRMGPSIEEVFNQTGPKNCTVFVGSLPNTCSENYIRLKFSKYGQIVDIRHFQGPGYAFVRFATKVAAARAICEANGTELLGHNIKCFWGTSDGTPAANWDDAEAVGH